MAWGLTPLSVLSVASWVEYRFYERSTRLETKSYTVCGLWPWHYRGSSESALGLGIRILDGTEASNLVFKATWKRLGTKWMALRCVIRGSYIIRLLSHLCWRIRESGGEWYFRSVAHIVGASMRCAGR
ncbi:hypothetical protein F4809DRAFT_217566 [Biscogniauxia mediterranea]|nr:hypothetical protein F4809DRAFT_217566 [Biscogniauxia mediterranea]